MEIDGQLTELLSAAQRSNASDLHITVGAVPMMRIDNALTPAAGQPKLSQDDTRRMIYSMMDENHSRIFEEKGEVDFSFGISRIGRFRVNAYHQRGSCAAAVRIMGSEIPSPDFLGLPETVSSLYTKQSGLILVTGPTGSGKSTTIASIIQKINENRHCHILTLEDPIEYLYQHGQSLVDQREIGMDSASFAAGLRAALREDPDVILVGEMRDLETISTAITAAETGHLVFSTLHTSGAAQTIDRIVDVFPEGQKSQIRTQLSMVMESVVSQRLVPNANGVGRTPIFEIMHCTTAIRSLIREDKTFQIQGIMQTNKKLGMQTMDDGLLQAVRDGIITKQSALDYASDLVTMRSRLERL